MRIHQQIDSTAAKHTTETETSPSTGPRETFQLLVDEPTSPPETTISRVTERMVRLYADEWRVTQGVLS